jgi:hypothetical protein
MTIGLSDYQFQLNTTGVLLNGNDTVVPYVDIEKVVGLDSPPFRETIRDHEGTDGGFMDAEFEKGREIVLDGTAFCLVSNVEPYLDLIKANYAPVTSPIPFYFKSTGVDERVIFVKPRGVRFDWETVRRIGMTAIQFMMYAEDPRIYTNTLNSTTINYGGDTGIGFSFSFSFSFDFGGGSTPSGANVTNNGNRATPVVLTITGPVINPVIFNNTTGNVLRFTIELTALDTLTINTGNRTVYLNGNINRRSTLTLPDWFLLTPGINQISYGGLTGTGSTLNLQFRDAWR